MRRIKWLGFILGFALVALSLGVDFVYNKLPFSFQGFVIIYSSNPLQWILLTSPLFLGAIFLWINFMISTREQKLEVQISNEKRNTAVVTTFIEKMVKGDYSRQDQELDTSVLQNLDLLRERLKDEQDNESKRRWVNEGLSQFTEITKNQNSIEEISFAFLTSLINYIKYNQGAVFIAEQDDDGKSKLVLKACYAYERKKHLQKIIPPGEGLAGQCYLEAEINILSNVPDDYVQIRSGLGHSTPDCIVLLPLKTQDSIEGVIELAGFRKLQEFEIEYLKKICDNFAAVLKNVGMAKKTEGLLEITRQQAESLKLKEEELRQNMKDMEDTLLSMMQSKSHD